MPSSAIQDANQPRSHHWQRVRVSTITIIRLKTLHDGTQRRTTKGGCSEQSNRNTSVYRIPDVREDATDDRQGGTAEESGKKPRYQDSLHVLAHGHWDLEDSEHGIANE